MKLTEDWLKSGTAREYFDFLLRNQVVPYRGRERIKNPIDDAHYEYLIARIKPDAILELGCKTGGSALWYLDRLRIHSDKKPLAVGVDIVATDENNGDFIIIKGSFLDHGISRKVYELLDGRNVLVIEDAAHTYECSIAAFKLYSPLVAVGGYYIMEDIIVNCGGIVYTGVEKAAIEAADNLSWCIDRSCERWGLTFHPRGWLRRIN